MGLPDVRVAFPDDVSGWRARIHQRPQHEPPALLGSFNCRDKMGAIEQALVTFFEQVARKDRAQLKKLEQEQCFSVEQGRWCFTLPDLYSYLQNQDSIFGSIDYKQFRKLIFDSPINRTAKLYGAEITVSDNRAKVDQSSYVLVWHDNGKE